MSKLPFTNIYNITEEQLKALARFRYDKVKIQNPMGEDWVDNPNDPANYIMGLYKLPYNIKGTIYIPPVPEPVEVEKSSLIIKINEIELMNLDGSLYTPSTFLGLESQLDYARDIRDNKQATQEMVNDVLLDLITAFNLLELIEVEPDPEPVVKDLLIAEISRLGDLKLVVSHYTESSWLLYDSALTHAVSTEINDSATQLQVDNALTGLTNAFNGLVLDGSIITLEILTDKYNEYESIMLDVSKYTYSSYVYYMTARNHAMLVINDIYVDKFGIPYPITQTILDNAYNNLVNRFPTLVLIDKTLLIEKINEYSLLEKSSFTAQSWVPFNNVLNQAILTRDNPESINQSIVDDHLLDLINAFNNLEVKGDSVEVYNEYTDFPYTNKTDWGYNYPATIKLTDGVVRFNFNTDFHTAPTAFRDNQRVLTSTGDIYYHNIGYNPDIDDNALGLNGNDGKARGTHVPNEWNRQYTKIVGTSNGRVFMIVYPNNFPLGTGLSVKEPLAINLTKSYGKGNEPDIDDFHDKMMNQHDGYFSGSAEIV